MRRSTVAVPTALALALGLVASSGASASPVHGPPGAVRAVDLRTDGRADPLGIDDTSPLLAWKLESPGNAGSAGQRAYQVRAAHSLTALKRGDADVWDSGKVDSSATSGIAFNGTDLTSRESVTWQVRVWDASGRASHWSKPATWEMGLLNPSDWSARWIENSSYDYTRPDGSVTPLPVFGRSFSLHGRVAKARLYMTGLGMYDTTLNGHPISPDVLEPGQTTYSAEVDYRTYDLTDQLKSGTNMLGISTGSGAYQRVKTPGHYFFGGTLEQYTVYGEPKAIAQLEITYADGHRETVKSDTSWRTALGPTTYSSWWSGEEYDGRRAADAPTTAANLTGPAWQKASLVKLTAATTPRDTTPLRADPRPPVTVARTVEPVAITSRGNGSYILDFGANRSGWPNLDVSGPAGTTVSMIPAELLKPDGSLDVSSTGASADSPIRYRYTLAGRHTETWHPRFTYSGFRYLQVDGLPRAPGPGTVTVDVIHAANPRASSFDSSNDVINQIHAITLRAMQSNMMSVMTDCPDREKGPYTGDNLHNIDALLTDYDLSSYEPQLVRNMATAQRKPGDVSPGLIANIAPEFHRVAPTELDNPQGTIEFLDEVNWGGAVIRIPWQLYQTYGDTRTMSLYYDNMVAWLDYEASNMADHNGDIPGLGDWSATDNTTPLQLPVIAGYYTAANDMAKIAEVLGKKADQATYTALASRLAADFTSRFRHQDTDGVHYGSDSETSDAMALDAGLVQPGDLPEVRGRLVAAIRTAGNHITSGSVGLGPLFRALRAAGRDDVIYDMVTNPTSPGYGYLVAGGHTTLSESLDGSGSQNHHFLGQVDSWFVDGLAGIGQSPGSVAYRELDIHPAVVGDLTHASGSYDTPQGTVTSAWRKDGKGHLTLKVTIPEGSTATVHVPAAAKAHVTTDGPAAPRLKERTGTAATYRATAGSYTFEVG